ncbi:hypothetical protein HPNQ4161_0421 [Helicobacter pylori NQ4161]|nr:hypothetical protein HPNQ4161_0421 [Helicobacter pylori NQ4161]
MRKANDSLLKKAVFLGYGVVKGGCRGNYFKIPPIPLRVLQ